MALFPELAVQYEFAWADPTFWAEVLPVTSGRGTLKDAMNDPVGDWMPAVHDMFYCIDTVAGPLPDSPLR